MGGYFRCKPSAQEGFKWTLNAVECLFLNLERQYNIESLSTCRLNQDPLENYFACIRSNCGSNINPNTLQFVAALKTSMINNLLHSSKNKNCKDYNNVILNDLKYFLTQDNPKKRNKSSCWNIWYNRKCRSIYYCNTSEFWWTASLRICVWFYDKKIRTNLSSVQNYIACRPEHWGKSFIHKF